MIPPMRKIGGEGKLDVEEEMFLQSLEEIGMRSVPGYKKNKWEKQLKF